MKNNNIPEYILCSTPELARQVLEKIERESDLVWSSSKEKPTKYIPHKNYFPIMLTEKSNKISFFDKDNGKGITNFTKAEDYLNNNYITEKTWENLQVGWVLEYDGDKFMILSIHDRVIDLSVGNNFNEVGGNFTKEELIKDGFKIKGASEDKPSLESVIKLLEDAIWKNDIENGRASSNVREAIEILKELK